MANKFTLPEYNEVKNFHYCVVSFKEGKRTLTYGNLSIKDAVEHMVKKQKQGEVCLLIDSSNTNGIEGLNSIPYSEDTETLDYYMKCLRNMEVNN